MRDWKHGVMEKKWTWMEYWNACIKDLKSSGGLVWRNPNAFVTPIAAVVALCLFVVFLALYHWNPLFTVPMVDDLD
jgi:hypothetical protein